MPAASPQQPLFDSRSGFEIRFPEVSDDLDQNEEWFEYELDGQLRRLRIHDYADLYSVPGLYEALVYEKLACRSPQRLAKLFAAVLTDAAVGARQMRVLDLGAGNGIVAEEFGKLGARHLVGVDLLHEAELAARRDRPGLYADYFVTDLGHTGTTDIASLQHHRLNCLVTVAALGFGDIPPEAFSTAFNSIASNGWLAMTIKEEFLEPDDASGFARLIRAMIEMQIVEIQACQRYCHRLSITGEKLLYLAVVARKKRHIPASLLNELDERTDVAKNNQNGGRIAMLLGKRE